MPATFAQNCVRSLSSTVRRPEGRVERQKKTRAFLDTVRRDDEGRRRPELARELLADLAEETGDAEAQVTALQRLLASAGPRRASVLRELMELSKPARASFNVKGRKGDEAQLLAFGRRLVGLGEMVPPEVFLDLGDAFLEALVDAGPSIGQADHTYLSNVVELQADVEMEEVGAV